MENLREHDKGPGLAASVIMCALIDRLRALGHLSSEDSNLIFDTAERDLAGDVGAFRDARAVIAKMRMAL